MSAIMTAMPTLLLLLLLGLQSAIAEVSLNDEKFIPLDKWMKQMDLRACLSSTPADLLFVVDGSQSVGSTNFHLLIKGALIDTISKFRIGERFTQVGVLVFSDQISQVIPIGRYSDKVQLLSAVSNLRYVDSFTSIEAAVEGSAAELQRRSHQRNTSHEVPMESVRKTVVVFMTDGWDNHGDSFYLRDLLAQMHLQVSGVVVLGLQNSNTQMLQQLATQPMLIFNPTTYPDFLASVLNLINSHCSDTCNKYEQQVEQAQHGIEVTVRYVNTITDNYASLLKQESSLIDYMKQVNSSANFAHQEILQTCEVEDNKILEKIVEIRGKLEKKENNTGFNGLTIDAFESQMLQTVNDLQTRQFRDSRELTIEKARRESKELQMQSLRSEFEARLKSKISMRENNEATLRALEERIQQQELELEKMEREIISSRNSTELLTMRLNKQEEEYNRRLEVMRKLSKEHTTLLTISNGGDYKFNDLTDQIAECESYLRNHEAVLFAIKCGSGASFESIFSLQDSTFSSNVFTGLNNSEGLFKSNYLRNLHTMGYFKDASLQFLVDGNIVATLTMDTKRFELANIFSRFHVTSSFPYVASYINSVYRSSLSQFRLRSDSEFLMIFGDLAKYLETGLCEDLQGVFVVLNQPHRCYPEAKTFPQVYIAASPYGGRMQIACSEFRIVTSQLPKQRQLTTITTTNDDKDIEETLLFIKSGAGLVSSLLLTDKATSASVLLDVDDVTQLSRHYKSSILNQIYIKDLSQVQVEIYNSQKEMVAQLTFKGPFDYEKQSWIQNSGGSSYDSWSWFQAKYLESAEPFDLRQLKLARFDIYDGKQLLNIGVDLAGNCEQRKYFFTIVDGESPCQCFSNVSTPAVFFASGPRAQTCDKMKQASSVRIIGTFNRSRV